MATGSHPRQLGGGAELAMEEAGGREQRGAPRRLSVSLLPTLRARSRWCLRPHILYSQVTGEGQGSPRPTTPHGPGRAPSTARSSLDRKLGKGRFHSFRVTRTRRSIWPVLTFRLHKIRKAATIGNGQRTRHTLVAEHRRLLHAHASLSL